MTEAEWLASNDPAAMASVANSSPRATERVCRLFLAAFWGWQGPRLRSAGARDRLREYAELVARWAEDGTPAPEVADIYDRTRVVFFDPDARNGFVSTAGAPVGWGKRGKPAVRRAAVLIREMFGPAPFRTVAADPNWLTSTVLALARGIYDERAFDRLPILADALQDAGCESDDVLNHCRDRKAVHARGCWVVDLLLVRT